jgi:hypothetical protein
MIMGAIAAVFMAAVIVNLSLLDIITVPELRDSLGKSLMVIAVTTVAIVLMITITRIGRQPQNPDQQPKR